MRKAAGAQRNGASDEQRRSVSYSPPASPPPTLSGSVGTAQPARRNAQKRSMRAKGWWVGSRTGPRRLRAVEGRECRPGCLGRLLERHRRDEQPPPPVLPCLHRAFLSVSHLCGCRTWPGPPLVAGRGPDGPAGPACRRERRNTPVLLEGRAAGKGGGATVSPVSRAFLHGIQGGTAKKGGGFCFMRSTRLTSSPLLSRRLYSRSGGMLALSAGPSALRGWEGGGGRRLRDRAVGKGHGEGRGKVEAKAPERSRQRQRKGRGKGNGKVMAKAVERSWQRQRKGQGKGRGKVMAKAAERPRQRPWKGHGKGSGKVEAAATASPARRRPAARAPGRRCVSRRVGPKR